MVGVRESFLPAWTACLLYFIVATWPVTTIPAKGDDSFATADFPNAGTSTLLQHDGWHTSTPLLQGIHLEGLQRPLPLSHELVYFLKMRDQRHSVSCTVEGVAMQPDSQLQTTYLQLPDVGPQKQVFPVSPQVFLGSQLPACREELNTRSLAHHIEPATSACKTHRALSAAVCNEMNALGDGAQGQASSSYSCLVDAVMIRRRMCNCDNNGASIGMQVYTAPGSRCRRWALIILARKQTQTGTQVGTAPGLMDMSGSRSAQPRQLLNPCRCHCGSGDVTLPAHLRWGFSL